MESNVAITLFFKGLVILGIAIVVLGVIGYVLLGRHLKSLERDRQKDQDQYEEQREKQKKEQRKEWVQGQSWERKRDNNGRFTRS
jgi:hypothetical protein